MAMSDRAFRALVHAEPEVLLHALRLLAPRSVSAALATTARIEDMGATRQDALSPPEDADSVMFLGDDALLHTEGQGYRDGGFLERVLRYHLWLALRYPRRHVRTVALWLINPPRSQATGELTHNDITVRVTPLVLPRAPAELLLEDARTACFAAGANPGAMPVDTLCRAVAKALRASDASWYRRHIWSLE